VLMLLLPLLITPEPSWRECQRSCRAVSFPQRTHFPQPIPICIRVLFVFFFVTHIHTFIFKPPPSVLAQPRHASLGRAVSRLEAAIAPVSRHSNVDHAVLVAA